MHKKTLSMFCALLIALFAMSYLHALGEKTEYSYEVFPLERNGIALCSPTLKPVSKDIYSGQSRT